MTKPTWWVCDQQGSRPACASTQSDQDPCCSLTNPISSRETDSEQHGSWSDCTDAQAGLDPCWSQKHYVGFVVTWLKSCSTTEQPLYNYRIRYTCVVLDLYTTRRLVGVFWYPILSGLPALVLPYLGWPSWGTRCSSPYQISLVIPKSKMVLVDELSNISKAIMTNTMYHISFATT
jgi:hypothetical protein